MKQDCKNVRTSTAEFVQKYISLIIPIDAAGAGAPCLAAPDCGPCCWMLLVTFCPSSALLSLFLYLLCSHMGRTSCVFIHWKSFCTSFDCVVSCNSNSVCVSVCAGKDPEKTLSQETRPLTPQHEVSDSSPLTLNDINTLFY